VKVISQREFRNNSAAIMAAVETGETFHVTRNGVAIAELRPIHRRGQPTAAELVAKRQNLPRVDYRQLRADADEFFGNEGRLTPEDDGESLPFRHCIGPAPNQPPRAP
jgi:antitoxin (DNA-binding transcriptional repressor) of toxin-antitoxin stability system